MLTYDFVQSMTTLFSSDFLTSSSANTSYLVYW